MLGAQAPRFVQPGSELCDLVARRLELVQALQIGDADPLIVDLALKVVFFAGQDGARAGGKRGAYRGRNEDSQ